MTARAQAIPQLDFSLDRHGIVPEDRLFSASKRGSNFCYDKFTCPWILLAGNHKVKFKFQIRGIETAKSVASAIRRA
jgi:hypothetical protein